MPTTPIYALPYPLSTDSPDAPTQFRALAERTEAVLGPALPGSGTTAARPAPTPGAVYYATDTNITWHGIAVAAVNYWAPPPGTLVARLRGAGGQSIPNTNTATPVIFGVEEVDLLNCYTPTASSTLYRPLVPGQYLFTGGVGFPNDASGSRGVSWIAATAGGPAGTQISGSLVNGPPTPATGTAMAARPLSVRLNGIDDGIQLAAQHNATAALTTTASAAFTPTMHVVYAGP
jgi:hypothetical protein